MIIAESLRQSGNIPQENIFIFSTQIQNYHPLHISTAGQNSPDNQYFRYDLTKTPTKIESIKYSKRYFTGGAVTPEFILDFIRNGNFLKPKSLVDQSNENKIKGLTYAFDYNSDILDFIQEDFLNIDETLNFKAKKHKLLLFFAGHGDTDIIKINDLFSIHSYDLFEAIVELYQKTEIDEICLIIDSCKSGSIVRRIKNLLIEYKNSQPIENRKRFNLKYIGISSSEADGKSISAFHHPYTSISLVDRFSLRLSEFINGRIWESQKNIDKDLVIQNFALMFPKKYLLSDIVVDSNYSPDDIWSFFHM